jgi:hypothetical protein
MRLGSREQERSVVGALLGDVVDAPPRSEAGRGTVVPDRSAMQPDRRRRLSAPPMAAPCAASCSLPSPTPCRRSPRRLAPSRTSPTHFTQYHHSVQEFRDDNKRRRQRGVGVLRRLTRRRFATIGLIALRAGRTASVSTSQPVSRARGLPGTLRLSGHATRTRRSSVPRRPAPPPGLEYRWQPSDVPDSAQVPPAVVSRRVGPETLTRGVDCLSMVERLHARFFGSSPRSGPTKVRDQGPGCGPVP